MTAPQDARRRELAEVLLHFETLGPAGRAEYLDAAAIDTGGMTKRPVRNTWDSGTYVLTAHGVTVEAADRDELVAEWIAAARRMVREFDLARAGTAPMSLTRAESLVRDIPDRAPLAVIEAAVATVIDASGDAALQARARTLRQMLTEAAGQAA